MPDRRSELVELIDHTTITYLDDTRYAAGMCVNHHGQSWPWLLAPDADDSDRRDHGEHHGCRAVCCAPHEQAGPLPARIRARINRCQHARGSWRCSRPAPLGQDRCWQHTASAGSTTRDGRP